ncbi:hypothetical protein FRX31_020938 [Thalictrum thalictroides]|uniref:Uncharacterized protein n=1 Tax=Thalictrum thalictroides TaxID=46969 RepID=A0A7J6VXB9_THATH|nr:hypothetical protein FRX31_020938 [Thalictrum thalictroides]
MKGKTEKTKCNVQSEIKRSTDYRPTTTPHLSPHYDVLTQLTNCYDNITLYSQKAKSFANCNVALSL